MTNVRPRLMIPTIGIANLLLGGLVHALLWAGQAGSTAKTEEAYPSPPHAINPPTKAAIPPLGIAPFSESQASGHQEAWASHLAKPVEIINSIGMKLRLIPPGEFMMGSPESEQDLYHWERPQHWVRITKPFYLGVYEVTQSEYERVMGTNPSWFAGGGNSSDCVSELDTSRFPVEHVSWADAVEFCRRLSAMSAEQAAGRVYRLPTEAEWEYACRAGTTTPFHFGSVLNGRQANCLGEVPYGTINKGPYLQRPARVGSYDPNGFGLYDMHGNVAEWVSDWYARDYYAQSLSEDPPGPASGSRRAIRGGSWVSLPLNCRSANRWGLTPARQHRFLGFRVALAQKNNPKE